MSYANAAAQSGPIGAEKVPEIPKPEVSQPSGNIEVVPQEDLDKFRQAASDKVDEIAKDAKKAGKKAETFFDKLLKNVKQTFTSVSQNASKYSSCAGSKFESGASVVAKEFQNPVVIAQTLVGITAVVSGYFAYLERKRINTSNKWVLGIHGAVITGLVLADGYLFQTYYPKYKKN